jgi:hypothetical protein
MVSPGAEVSRGIAMKAGSVLAVALVVGIAAIGCAGPHTHDARPPATTDPTRTHDRPGTTTTSTAAPAAPATPDVRIDYGQPTVQLSPFAFGMAETGYQSPHVLATDAREQQQVTALHLGYIRMDLAYAVPGDPTSKIICADTGCDPDPTGDQWISTIKQTGAEPVVIVNIPSATDAANMVKHFNINPTTNVPDSTRPNYVKYWIIGNEPDRNGYSPSSYSASFNADDDAMKVLDPNIKIGGPAVASYNQTWLQQFLQVSGSRVDFVDFHGYPQQGTTDGDVPTLFRWATNTGNDVSNLRRVIQSTVTSRASQIGIEVGEWSLNWDGNAQGDTNFNTVWTADVLGHILANGGLSVYFGTKGNAIKWADHYVTDDLGHTVYMHLDDPRAPYHGYGMFTGEGLFPSFGTTLMRASTTLPNIDVFASNNPKNIVVINKDQSTDRTATLSLTGVSTATIDVWQKNQHVPFKDPPIHLGTINTNNGTFNYDLPATSVTTFLVTPTYTNAGT